MPITSKFVFFHLILYITQWTSAKKSFQFRWNPTFLIILNVPFCRHFGLPVFPWFVRSWLESSHLFYFRKYRLVVHTKCQQGTFCTVWVSRKKIWFSGFKKLIRNHVLSKAKNFSQKFIAWNIGSDGKIKNWLFNLKHLFHIYVPSTRKKCYHYQLWLIFRFPGLEFSFLK